MASSAPSPKGLHTEPGMRHADMHPLTHERVNRHAEFGRALRDYGEAMRLLGAGEVLAPYASRKLGELQQALQRLVEAAQAEGAGDDAS
jgi:hypothetical protein